MGRQSNFALARLVQIHEDQLRALSQERTLVVQGVPKAWTSHTMVCGCPFIAQRVSRMALEQGCAIIEVQQGAHHRHRFDVADMLRRHVRRFGRLNPPRTKGPLPRFLGTFGHLAQGSTLERHRPTFAVSADTRGSHGGSHVHQ